MRFVQDICRVAVPVVMVFLGVVLVMYYGTFGF
jgi:hypothetical protein